MTLGLKYFQRTWRTQLYFFHMTNIFPDLLGAEAPFQTNLPWGGGLKVVRREVLTCMHCHPVSSLAVLVSSLPTPNPSSAESSFKGHIWASQSPQKLSVVELPTSKANSWTRCSSSSFELPSTSFPAPSLTIPSLSALKVQAALGRRHWTSMIQAVHMTSLHWTNHILFCIYCSAPFTWNYLVPSLCPLKFYSAFKVKSCLLHESFKHSLSLFPAVHCHSFVKH